MKPFGVFGALGVGLAMITSLAAAAEADGTEENHQPTAFVYVATPAGVYEYQVTKHGRLELVAGSPFQVKGAIVGSNGLHFLTLDSTTLYSYSVGPGGTIGGLDSQIDTQGFDGNGCGTASGGVLDHTGQDVYVLLNQPLDPTNPICMAYQSYSVNAGNGLLTFLGATTINTGNPSPAGLPFFIGNDQWAYATTQTDEPTEGVFLSWMSSFKRDSNGVLNNELLLREDPVAPYGPYYWFPTAVAADPNNNLAVVTYYWYAPPYGVPHSGMLLASYTVDNNTGYITSNNSYLDMPAAGYGSLEMSWDGTVVANYGDFGLQLFHFNGAATPTTFTNLLTSDPIDQAHWDKAGHLFAVSSSSNRVHVFNVTSTSAVEAPGSPYTVSDPTGLFVVPYLSWMGQ